MTELVICMEIVTVASFAASEEERGGKNSDKNSVKSYVNSPWNGVFEIAITVCFKTNQSFCERRKI